MKKKLKKKLKKIKKYLSKLEIKEKILEQKKRLDKYGKKGYIALGVIIVLVITTISYGRYIYNEIRDFYLTTKNFYFNSDKLTTNRAIYQIDNWSAVDPYTITINLNNKKNNLIHSNSDINYEVSYVCSDNVLCSVSSTGGTLHTDDETNTFNAVLNPNTVFEVGDEAFIEITVKSTYPYKKTLRGRFILKVGKSGLSYTIDDKVGRPYFNFNITNTIDYYLVKEAFDDYKLNDRIDRLTYIALSEENKRKCLSSEVTLKFNPEVVILDTTNTAYLKKESYTTTNINGYDYIDSITFRMDSESSEVVKFYKVDVNNDYTFPIINDTSVVEFSHSE